LNLHQIGDAMFASSSPLSKLSILADEIGLGKTIEASLLIAQRLAECKRDGLIDELALTVEAGNKRC
jgi:hypothetical protein